MRLRFGRILLAIIIVGLFVGVGYGGNYLKTFFIGKIFADLANKTPTVSAEAATADTWERTIPAIGTLRAVQGINVSPAVEGHVTQVSFKSGDTVAAGAVLLRMDADNELAGLKAAETALSLALITQRRTSELARTSAASQSSLDQANTDVKAKQAAVETVQAALAKRTILAPFAGTLGIRRVDLGQHLTAGAAITTLEDLSTMLLDFTVPQTELANLSVGQAVRLSTDAYPGKVFVGKINAIDVKIDVASGLVAIEAAFPNADGALKPGLFASVSVLRPVAAAVVTVPTVAVDYTLHGDSVFVVHKGDKVTVERVSIQVGDHKADRVAVTKGVKVGDVVVTAGQLKLRNGSVVTVAGDPLVAPATPSRY